MPISASSSELAEQLLQSGAEPLVGREPLPKTFDEKREFTRFPFRGRAKAVVFPAPSSEPGTELHDSEVVTSDLSRGGVSILYRGQLVPGQHLLLMLNDNNQLVEVRWCCRVWEGLFAAGCRFLGEPTAVNVDQQLLAIDVVITSEQSWWNADEAG
jgi:hypothetical protein